MAETANIEELKDQVIANQQMIDRLNADLDRKTREVHIIQEVSSEINTTLELDIILKGMLSSLDRVFGFKHSMVLLIKPGEEVLYVASSQGYKEKGIGAEVKFGEGVIGVVAKRKKLMRMGNIGAQLAYLKNVKTQMSGSGAETKNAIEVPGLSNVQSQVAIPLLSEDRLVGVLAVESQEHSVFDKRDEIIIQILANQAASAIEKAKAHQNLRQLNESLEDKVRERTIEVVKQKELVEEKNKEILSSIVYAKRIQDTLLPKSAFISKHLHDSFQLYLPKDIVSGDFYWINERDGKVFFAAVDCTGHGVPGAFLSIVAHGGLQRALHIFDEDTPAKILNRLNETVIQGFVDRSDSTVKDGMDVGMCGIQPARKKLEFAGANNPLYLIRNGELTEIKGDKQPIGFSDSPRPFTNHELDLEEGDCIYVFTDGFPDQFGGPKGKKYKYKHFKEFLISIHKKPMNTQKNLLADEFESWKGSLEQLDDLCVIGVRI